MRYRRSFGAVCLATLFFLYVCRESSAQAPVTAVAPFEAEQAKVHQKAWADYLGVPMEFTNSIGMTFVVIPPGEFTMGSPVEIIEDGKVVQEEERGREGNETQHTVTLSHAFSMGITEVTQWQYNQVVVGHKNSFNGANQPVENVTWNRAVAFCNKLSALPAERAAGRIYRLPTEAEWEYACRAGTTTAYSFGDDTTQLKTNAWYDENSDWTTHSVGQKPSNPWGLFDMHGNVWEWCSDWYGEYPSDAVSDPQGPAVGSYRVFRGGCWTIDAARCRSANRHAVAPAHRSSYTGIRVVSLPCALPPKPEPDK